MPSSPRHLPALACAPLTAVALLALASLGACKREQRVFGVEPPQAERIDSISQISISPGGQSPPPLPQKNEYEESAYALSEGKRLYTQFNCAGCHAHGGGDIGPPLADAKWIYGGNPEQIFASIVEGRPNGMPAFRGHLANFQVWQLAAYLRSMGGLVSRTAAPNRNDDLQISVPENSARKEPPQPASVPPNAPGQ